MSHARMPCDEWNGPLKLRLPTHNIRDSGAAGPANTADKAASSEVTVEYVLSTTSSRLDGIQYLDQVAGTVRRRVAMVTRVRLDG